MLAASSFPIYRHFQEKLDRQKSPAWIGGLSLRKNLPIPWWNDREPRAIAGFLVRAVAPCVGWLRGVPDLLPMRILILILLGLAADAGQAGPPSAYLATVGPAPMRFHTVARVPPILLSAARRDVVKNAPVASSDGSGSSELWQVSMGTPSALGITVSDRLTASELNDFPVLTNSLSLASNIHPVRVVSPPMLLHFFTDPSFTNIQAGVSLPISFRPPLPPTPVSSSATYTSVRTP